MEKPSRGGEKRIAVWASYPEEQETLSDLTRADQAQHIECGERVTTTHTEIVQAARNLHHEISDTRGGQAQDIFDNPTPFHPGNHVFYDHACAGDEVIEEPILHAQLLAFGFFLAVESAPPQAHSPENPCPCLGWRWSESKSAPCRPLSCHAFCLLPSAPDRRLSWCVR